MNHWLDHALVGILLAASAAYAVMSLGPRALRLRILAGLSRIAASAPRSLRLSRWAQKFALAAAAKPKGACGGCEDCGAGTNSTAPSASSEIKIPVGKIGRRA
jgi:hypothetical protein